MNRIKPKINRFILSILSILVQYFCISIEQLTAKLIDADVAEARFAAITPRAFPAVNL